MSRQTTPRTWLWMLFAFSATILSGAMAVAILGMGENGATAAVRATAIFSFLWFFAAYAGSPLAVLFGTPFDGLARRGRGIGLAFAAALSVHLGLVALTIERSSHAFVPNPLEIAEMVGATWIYALAVFSVPRLRLMLTPAVWRRLRVLGMDFIALIFVRNFVSFPLKAFYLPFLLRAVGAVALRISAAIRGQGGRIDLRDATNGMVH